MTLPRFNNGQVGELRWNHLNDAFDRIEAIEKRLDQIKSAMGPLAYKDIIIARLGVQGINNRYAWTQVAPTSNLNFPTMENGLRSTLDGDLYASEAIAVDGARYEVGDIVFLKPSVMTTGRNFMAIIRPAGSRVRVYRIIGATPISGVPTSSPAWRYDVLRTEVTFDPATDLYQWNDFAGSETDATIALNAAETVADTPTNIGLGTVLPSSVSGYTRQPIKSGTRVLCTDTGGSVVVFSMPNGYALNCGS
jgi:hypothetical protein